MMEKALLIAAGAALIAFFVPSVDFSALLELLERAAGSAIVGGR